MPSEIHSPRVSFFVGLDLGQAQDPSAIAALRRRVWPGESPLLDIIHLRRFELGMPYTEQAKQVALLLDRTEHASSGVRPLRGCVLGLDRTGVGRGVYDLFVAKRLPCRLHGIAITAGHTATQDAGGWKVPKADLVGAVTVLLQSHRLKWDKRLPFAKELDRELADFQTRITPAAHEQYGVWREGQHDDLVLAVAIAAWLAERAPPLSARPFTVGGMPSVLPTLGRPNGLQLRADLGPGEWPR
jgi:hypothetical protein